MGNRSFKRLYVKRLCNESKKIRLFRKNIKLIDIAGRIDGKLNGEEAQEIIKVINNYSNALNLLDDYDQKTILKPKGTNNDNKINYHDRQVFMKGIDMSYQYEGYHTYSMEELDHK